MRLIRGAPGSGKTALVFREFKEALSAGRRDIRIVAPTATLVRHFQHELARDGIVFSPRCIVSLNRLERERAGATTRAELVSGGLLRAIACDVLRRGPFPEFGEVGATDGMVSVLLETIDLFENAASNPEKLSGMRKPSQEARAFARFWRAVGDRVRAAGALMPSDLARAAIANTESARIWMDGFVSFSPLEQDFVRALAQNCELTLTLTDCQETDDIRRFGMELGAEDRLLRAPARKPGTTLVEAPTLEREAEEIARRIAGLHERGTRFRDIGVALRDPATYTSLLGVTFQRFGIPARFYFGSTLRKHPVATFLSGLISGSLEDWDFENTIETLRAHPKWGPSADFDRFDFAVRTAMPGHGGDALLTLCESERLRKDIEKYLKTGVWKNARATPAEWARRFESLARTLYQPGSADLPLDHTGVEAARSHTAALRAWSAAIASVVAFWSAADQAISLAEFHGVATEAIDSVVIHSVDDRADAVHVMSVYEARQWDLKSLFVCGMTDRDFPRQHPQNLLFPDSEIDRLRAAGIPLRKASDRDREECATFEFLRARAADWLILTTPRRDAAGKSVQLSRLLLNTGERPEQAPLCLAAPRFAAATPATRGRVDSPPLQAGLAELHRTISLTTLEDLAQCRFKFFGGKTLALKAAPESPGERLNPRITGSILHRALERWIADKDRNFVDLFEAAFDEMCREERLPAGYRLEVERMQFREIARRVRATGWWEVERSDAEVELALEFPGGIRVTCRIDRLDVFPNRDCVIIDYKSGKPAKVEKLTTSSTRLQGPLYALAVRENMHLNPVAMFYWAVRDDEKFGWGAIPGYTTNELQPMPENWADNARRRAEERLAGFLAGDVRARPEEAELCHWCEFRDACRVEQEAVMIEGASGA